MGTRCTEMIGQKTRLPISLHIMCPIYRIRAKGHRQNSAGALCIDCWTRRHLGNKKKFKEKRSHIELSNTDNSRKIHEK